MPRRILLTSSNRCAEPYPVFPLGLAYLDVALRRAGHTTRWFDCQAATEPFEQVLREFQPHVAGISLRNVDDIQLQSRQTYFREAIELCATVRRVAHCPSVLGGTAFSIYPQPLLALTGADYGIHGAGEIAFNRLIDALATGTDPNGIRGLVYRRDGQIVVNPRDPADCGSLAAAERPAELAEFYLQRSSMLNISTQRGCNLACCYCTYPLIEGRANHRREPDAVADELAAIQRQGAKHVFITDAVFNLTNGHVATVCEAILRRGVKLTWSCFLRPKNLTSELLALMKKAGLTHIEFGTDSFCDEVLVEYRKTFTFDDVAHSTELARAAGVHYSHYLICGGPGETAATLQTAFENSRQLPGAIIFALAGMRIYPGTALCARAEREGRLPAGDLLEPVYYISPALTESQLLDQLAGFKKQSSNWIVGVFPPEFAGIAQRLRQRGVVGPLWEYFGILQRMN